MPVPTLWSKAQFLSSQNLLSSGSLGVPTMRCWSQCHPGLRLHLPGQGDGGLPGRFWHAPYWPLPPLPGDGLRRGHVGYGPNARLHQRQLRWGGRSLRLLFSFLLLLVRVSWYHPYWQHVTTLSDVSCEILTTRHNSFRRVVWYHPWW